MPTVNDCASNPIQISPDDLIVRSGGLAEFPNCDEHLLSLVASTIVELSDCGGTDAYSAAGLVCEDHPESGQRWGRKYVEAIAQSLLAADILSLSKRYTELFTEFNARYFGGRLPAYEVRVVFDLHRVANEPIYMGAVSSGLIRFDERCIYIRYTQVVCLAATLVHEMAHAATSGEHDEEWLNEMKRLKDAGAPVDDTDVEPV